jgi:lipopolysaccharide/colanic/teichoic acid biosynthesis glycosyltransferase
MQNPFVGPTYERYLKRVIDIILAVVILLIFLPVCIVTAVAIKINSQGPILADVPERVGKNTKRFKMFKFRSMINNAHVLLRTDPRLAKLYQKYKKGSYKLKHDPRITNVGKFIRKHSIDEIPQLFNVLRGEMSVVGPRAYYKDELEHQQKKYPHTQALVTRVLSVRPGITGLWQVSGRSEINFDKRIALDAVYVDTISLANDLKIIFKTPWIMLTGRGAV